MGSCVIVLRSEIPSSFETLRKWAGKPRPTIYLVVGATRPKARRQSPNSAGIGFQEPIIRSAESSLNHLWAVHEPSQQNLLCAPVTPPGIIRNAFYSSVGAKQSGFPRLPHAVPLWAGKPRPYDR